MPVQADYTRREMEYVFRSNGFDRVKIECIGNGYTLAPLRRSPGI